MKKKLMSAISCVVILLLLSQTVFSFSSAAGAEPQQLSESVSVLENTLSENGTDVVYELNNLIAQFEARKAEAATAQEIARLDGLISTLEDLIAEYSLYTAGVSTYKYHLIYSPAVATVIAYFNLRGYLLAAELLTRAKEDTDEILYVPTYGARTGSSAVIQQIGNGTVDEGNASFEPGDSTIEMDLYYAIHSFNFFKPSPTSRVVYISDTYDFKHEEEAYETVAGIAIDMMCKAQDAGVLTPYVVLIAVEV